jgi:integrase
MPRQPLPLGAYGKINAWQDGSAWIARTQFRDYDGVVRPVKRRGRTKAAAERALKTALIERQTPVAATEVAPNDKVSKVADLWFARVTELVEEGRRSPGTLDTYRYVYDGHVKPAMAEMRVREVTTPVADRVLSAIKKETPSGARIAKTVLSGIMGYAVRHGAVPFNPIRDVARIENPAKRRPRALTADERATWLNAVEDDERAREWDLPDLTRLMLATGCRIGEALAIGWADVDLDAAVVDIRWRLVRRKGQGLLRLPSTKSGRKGERLVPLPTWAVMMLRERRDLIGADVEPVFPDSLGGWRDPSNVRRVWRDTRDRLEMHGLVTHTMRKTVASFLDDAEVSTRRISDQLGHAKVSMTQDHYLGRRLTDRQTADVLESIFDTTSDAKSVPKVSRDLDANDHAGDQ